MNLVSLRPLRLRGESVRLTPSHQSASFLRFVRKPESTMKELDALDSSNIEQSQETTEAPPHLTRADLTDVHAAAKRTQRARCQAKRVIALRKPLASMLLGDFVCRQPSSCGS